VCVPCTASGREIFLQWFSNITMPIDKLWIFLGDFNLIRAPDNQNKPRDNIQNMMDFNNTLSQITVQEIP
jgi:hypothetical protein